MLKGIYSAAAGMTSQMILTDTTADNMANVNTPGYKISGIQFKTFGDALVNRLGNNQEKELGHIAQGSQVLRSVINYQQGDLQETGNPLDLALNGEGFFTVKLPDKNNAIVYTRAGDFTRDGEGYLTNTSGGRIQGNNGDILIPRQTKKIDINQSGEILADGKVIEQLKVVQFSDMQALKRTGASYYTAMESDAQPAKNTTVEQGFIEHSNANVITEMVNNMVGLRVYETLQKSIQMQNETLGKSVNEVGRI